jgi:hypothetical protein
MAIEILPMLIDALPIITGGVASLVAALLFYFKGKKTATDVTQAHENKPQAEVNPSPPPKQHPTEAVVVNDLPEQEVVPVISQPVPAEVEIDSGILGECILKRHHLSNIRQMLIALSPQPTDSVLSRHYEEMIDVKAEECFENEEKLARLVAEYEALQSSENAEENSIAETESSIAARGCDEEPMLHRHQMSRVRIMVEATTFPRPTDSALNRHYDETIDAQAVACLENEEKLARLVAEYEALQSSENADENSVAETESSIAACGCDEEPMLKRHHLNNTRLMLIATTFPRPTDSALSRHYDEMIDAKAEDCLDNEEKMARLVAEYEAMESA